MRESVESLRLQLEASEKARDALLHQEHPQDGECQAAYRCRRMAADYGKARDALAAQLRAMLCCELKDDCWRCAEAVRVLDAHAPGRVASRGE